jgi:hypothetical protein
VIYEISFLTAGTKAYGTAVVSGMLDLIYKHQAVPATVVAELQLIKTRVASSRWLPLCPAHLRKAYKSLTQVLEFTALECGDLAKQCVVIVDDKCADCWDTEHQSQVLQVQPFYEMERTTNTSGAVQSITSDGQSLSLVAHFLLGVHSEFVRQQRQLPAAEEPADMTVLMQTALIDYIVQLRARGRITQNQMCAQLKHLRANSTEQPATTMHVMLIEFRKMVSAVTADDSNSNPYSDAYNSSSEDNNNSTCSSSNNSSTTSSSSSSTDCGGGSSSGGSSSSGNSSFATSAAQSRRAVLTSNDKQFAAQLLPSRGTSDQQQQEQQQQQQQQMMTPTSRSHADRYNNSSSSKLSSYISPDAAAGSSKRLKLQAPSMSPDCNRR